MLRIEGEANVKGQSKEEPIKRGMKLYNGAVITVEQGSRLVILDLESKSRIIVPDPSSNIKKTQNTIRFTYKAEFETREERDQAAGLTLKEKLTKTTEIVERDTSSYLTRNIDMGLEQEIEELEETFGGKDNIDYLWALHYLYIDRDKPKAALKILNRIVAYD